MYFTFPSPSDRLTKHGDGGGVQTSQTAVVTDREIAPGWAGMPDGWRVGVIVWPLVLLGAMLAARRGAGVGAGRASRPQKAFVNITKYALANFAILTYYFAVSAQQNFLTNSNNYDKIRYHQKRGSGLDSWKSWGSSP